MGTQELNMKGWSAEEWEKYLSELETPLTEKLLDEPYAVEQMSIERHEEGFSSLMGQNYTPHLKGLYGMVIDTLTPLQQKVITDIYWNHRTLGEIAKEMGVSKTAINQAKGRAEYQIKKRLDNFQQNQLQRLQQEKEKNITESA